MTPFAEIRDPEEPSRTGTRPSLASLLALFDSVPALLWETDSELRFTCLAGAAVRAAAIIPERHMTKPVESLFSERACAAHHGALLGHTASFDVELNGREFQANVKPLRTSEGAINGVIGIALDMTDHMVAERALRLSEHTYRSLVEEAPYAICKCTLGGELLQVNRAMAEMLGYDQGNIAELLLRDLPKVFRPACTFDTFQRTLLGQHSVPGTDSVWVRRDGGEIQVRLSGRVVRDPSGNVSHLDVFAENVTEKKRLEADLSQAQKMQAIGQLAGGVAHDFNNLLTVIIGQTDLLLSTSQPDIHERLMEVSRAAQKAASLTKQLLAFSRRQLLQVSTVNLNDVIGNLVAMLARVIKEDVRVVFLPGDKLGNVNVDPNEMQRVLLNLVVNAQDAMPTGGRLTIETANVRIDQQGQEQENGIKAGEYVQVVVGDTGVGMSPEVQARAFEPFFTTKDVGKGTGLGLPVVYGIVKQSGGHIHLESRAGVGTTFWIHLPRVAAAVSPAPQPAPNELLPRGSETILVVEDDEGIRTLVSRTLEGLGYRVLTAPDGVEAMRVANAHRGGIHLLLTDMVMPVMGGSELACTLRSTSPGLKVVFITGHAGHSIASRDLEVMGAGLLQKPFSMNSLADVVRVALDGQQASLPG
jgi:PAS domain S-box-containing protein